MMMIDNGTYRGSGVSADKLNEGSPEDSSSSS